MGANSRQVLEFKADCIERTLREHRAPVRVTGGLLLPRFQQFNLTPYRGVKVGQIIARAEELALALGVERLRVRRLAGCVSVEIPRSDPKTVYLSALCKRHMESHLAAQGDPLKSWSFGSAVLGLGSNGQPLLIRLPSTNVTHILIAGTTGSGKSVLATAIVTSLAFRHPPDQFRFVFIDPKRRGFGPLAGLPHLTGQVIQHGDEALQTLNGLVALMVERDHEGVQPYSAGKPGPPRIVVVIDELADLLAITGGAAQEPLTRLVQRGREAGIHLIASLQKPLAGLVGPLALGNFPVRLVGQVTNPSEAAIATGFGETGAETLRGPGDFLAVAEGSFIRFQGAFISPEHLAPWVARLSQKYSRVAPVDFPQPEPEPEATTPERESERKLQEYVGKGVDVWLKASHGGRFTGKKADLAQAIFGNRSTAGHQGKWVGRVITYLEANPPQGGGGGDPIFAEVNLAPPEWPIDKQTGEPAIPFRWCRITFALYRRNLTAWKVDRAVSNIGGEHLEPPSGWHWFATDFLPSLFSFFLSDW